MSLHKVSSEIHFLVKWIGIVVGGGLALYLLVAAGMFVKEIISPTPPPPPTVSFGTLPEIEFPASLSVGKNTYVLNTLTGRLPNFPDRATVYKIDSEEPNLLAIQRARERVSRLGFSGNGTALSPTMYQWNEAVSPFRKITVEILNFNFDLTSSYLFVQDIVDAKNLPAETASIKTVDSFLDSLSAKPLNIDTEKTTTTLYRIESGQLAKATSFSTTQLIRVDLYHKAIDSLDLYYPNPPFSTMNFLVAGGKIGGQVVEAHYFNHNITEESATYPLITAEEAWKRLEEGKAYVVSGLINTNNTVAIKDVKLGYYAGNKAQEYLMPIIIFEGDNDFYAYVSAVQEEWINQEK